MRHGTDGVTRTGHGPVSGGRRLLKPSPKADQNIRRRSYKLTKEVIHLDEAVLERGEGLDFKIDASVLEFL